MLPRMSALPLVILLVLIPSASLSLAAAPPTESKVLPKLSAQDRVDLAVSLVKQGQCKNALVELNKAIKDLPTDETLLRLKAICEAELQEPQAKDSIMTWLTVAPQEHPERPKMLALLAKTQAASETPTDWVLVPAGEFPMGAVGKLASPDEGPVHTVHVDTFYIGKFEVTNRQYHSFVIATARPTPAHCCDAKFNLWHNGTPVHSAAALPVINVSWADAAAYCKWSGGRLPTEAEWEKAARGIDGRTYPWGNEPISGNRANFRVGDSATWEGPASLAKKDQYEFGRSPYGAYEMAGNVWEWVQDWYEEGYYKASPPKNPAGPKTGRERVVRGGSWRDPALALRVTHRSKAQPTAKSANIGIRCAKDAARVEETRD